MIHLYFTASISKTIFMKENLPVIMGAVIAVIIAIAAGAKKKRSKKEE
ncbi:MAG: hypothetical protein R2800_02670 [Flavipsychrobacter sp.]